MQKNQIWILIRILIIYEINRYFNGDVSYVKQLNQASPGFAPNRLKVLKEKRQAIIEAVQFYKTLPLPEGKLDTFGVKYTSADQYLFDVMGTRGIQKHLFNLIPPSAHFGFREDGGVLKFYSDGNQIARILPDGKIEPGEGPQGIMLIAFLVELFGHALMPTLQDFMKIEIESTLDAFMKHAEVI